MNTILPNNPASKLSKSRFWLPLILQILLITSVPAAAVYTYMTGRTVILQTAPVDPYSPILGYSQNLSYDISQMTELKKLSGWKDFPKSKVGDVEEIEYGKNIYLILEAPINNQNNNQNNQKPQPWRPIAISPMEPKNLPTNQIFLKGKSRANRVEYGLETYYMPEERIREINQEFTDVARIAREQGKLSPIVMEVKIDNKGAGVPVSLWVSDRKYTF